MRSGREDALTTGMKKTTDMQEKSFTLARAMHSVTTGLALPTLGAVKLLENDGLVFGSGWHHDALKSEAEGSGRGSDWGTSTESCRENRPWDDPPLRHGRCHNVGISAAADDGPGAPTELRAPGHPIGGCPPREDNTIELPAER